MTTSHEPAAPRVPSAVNSSPRGRWTLCEPRSYLGRVTTPETPADPLPETATGPYDPELRLAGQLTSPTWELELFLSGAFVFASFQLPAVIEGVFRRLEPHVTESTAFILFTGTLYAKAIAFTLIATFLIHLVSRAQWVALLGLHSVFPRGIRWDEMKVGPMTKEVYRAYMPDLARVIARLDNFCSIVFAAGLLLVVMFAYSTLLVSLLSGVAYLLALAFTHGQGTQRILMVVGAVFVAVPAVSSLVDKRYGERMASGARGTRVLRAALRFTLSISMMRLLGPMMWTLISNVGRRRAVVYLYVALAVLLLLSAGDRLAQSNRLSFNSYDYFGNSLTHGVRSENYENQRVDGERYSRVPSIQSDIIGDAYVKLFIPYSPQRNNAAMQRQCPGVKRLQDRGMQLGADPYLEDSLVVPALACLARLHTVTLDGIPQPRLDFAFYEQPRTGIKGIVTYIPADSLARGRHVITLMNLPPSELPTDSTELANASWRKPMQIPFWR